MSKLGDLVAVKEQMEGLKAQMVDQGREVFTEVSAEIFEKHGPDLKKFGWTQYTPYFNDGEPCVFGRGHTFVNDDEDSYFSTYEGSENSFEDIVSKDVEALKEALGDDVLLDLFGDHAMVVVTREGVDVENYDHD